MCFRLLIYLIRLLVLLERTGKVQGEVDKLTAGNGMLQTYIDNLTKQITRK